MLPWATVGLLAFYARLNKYILAGLIGLKLTGRYREPPAF
jgi:hypothetical protein